MRLAKAHQFGALTIALLLLGAFSAARGWGFMTTIVILGAAMLALKAADKASKSGDAAQ